MSTATAPRTVKIATDRIIVGRAKDEGRAPSHDGEYQTILKWRSPRGYDLWVIEGNGGVVAGDETTASDLEIEDDDEWWAEVQSAAAALNVEDGDELPLDQDDWPYGFESLDCVRGSL